MDYASLLNPARALRNRRGLVSEWMVSGSEGWAERLPDMQAPTRSRSIWCEDRGGTTAFISRPRVEYDCRRGGLLRKLRKLCGRMSAPQPIGIDFGTTKTLVCRWDERSQRPVPIRLGRSRDLIPTSIHVDARGEHLEYFFGDDADDNQVLDAYGYVPRVKREIGKKPRVLHGQKIETVLLVEKFLGDVRRRIEDETPYGPVGYTVITVPALFGPAAKASLKEAAEKAGFTELELLDEPVAGGLAFLHDTLENVPGEDFLVFDWGGGTLDLAVVRRKDDTDLVDFPNLIGGVIALGGEDIDDSIMEAVSAMLKDQERPSLEDQPESNRIHARRALIAGKEALSRKERHNFRLQLADAPLEFMWTRGDLELLVGNSVEQAVSQTKVLVDKARKESITLDGIILIGGSSKFPMIERRLAEVTGIRILKYDQGQEAVALGAALRAHSRVSRVAAAPSNATNSPPPVQPQTGKESVRADGNNSESPTPPKIPDADARAAAMPASTVASATKENPFVNSLGMKFVPVPISGGPSGGKRVLFSIWETRVQDYEVYAQRKGIALARPTFIQGATHPVVNVSYEDAEGFCIWLTNQGRTNGEIGPKEAYRLPSDHEWSCAVGIGSIENANESPSEKDGKFPTLYPWGFGFPPPESAGNYNSKATMPVGSFTADTYGLFDLGGNVWEFCEDLYGGNTAAVRVSRGGSHVAQFGTKGWYSSYRNVALPTYRNEISGFRVILAEVAAIQSPLRAPPVATPSAEPGRYCPICKKNVIPVFSTGMSTGTKIEAAVATAAAIIAAPFLIATMPWAIFGLPVAASQEIKKLKEAPKVTKCNCPKCGHKF